MVNFMHEGGYRIEAEQEVITTTVGSIHTATVKSDRTGKEALFYRFNFADWVNIVALTEEGKLLCIRQYRFGTQRMELEIPGGAIEKGEDPVEAAVRELLEETGYHGINARIIGCVYPNPALQGNRCYTVLVEQAKLVADQDLDDMEEIEVFTMSPEEMKNVVTRGELKHGLVLNALMFYALQKDNLT